MGTKDLTPEGRGCDYGLSYFTHGPDYLTSKKGSCDGQNGQKVKMTDLWHNGAPASLDYDYVEDLFKATAISAITGTLWANNTKSSSSSSSSTSDAPLYLNYNMHLPHLPAQITEAYKAKYSQRAPQSEWLAGMISYIDDTVHEIVTALKTTPDHYAAALALAVDADAGAGAGVETQQAPTMWDNTFLVFFSDNGGAIRNGVANNYPLRGSKWSMWDGGIRVSAFVAGGIIPAAARGGKHTGLSHVADWYGTFCELAGVEQHDPVAEQLGLPQPDSLDLWPSIALVRAEAPGGNVNGSSSLQLESTPVPPSSAPPAAAASSTASTASAPETDAENDAAVRAASRSEIFVDPTILIQGEYKLIFGTNKIDRAFTTSAVWPTDVDEAAPDVGSFVDCSDGCLYNVYADPTESTNLAHENRIEAARLRTMIQRLKDLNLHIFNPPRGSIQDPKACMAAFRRSNTWGPFVDTPALISITPEGSAAIVNAQAVDPGSIRSKATAKEPNAPVVTTASATPSTSAAASTSTTASTTTSTTSTSTSTSTSTTTSTSTSTSTSSSSPLILTLPAPAVCSAFKKRKTCMGSGLGCKFRKSNGCQLDCSQILKRAECKAASYSNGDMAFGQGQVCEWKNKKCSTTNSMPVPQSPPAVIDIATAAAAATADAAESCAALPTKKKCSKSTVGCKWARKTKACTLA